MKRDREVVGFEGADRAGNGGDNGSGEDEEHHRGGGDINPRRPPAKA